MSLKRSLLIFTLLMLPLTGLTVNGVLYSSSSYQSCLSFSATGYTCGAGLVAKDVNVIVLNSDTDHDLLQYRPQDWKVSSVNITLSNITAPTHTMEIETYGHQALPLYLKELNILIVGVMSFSLTPGQRVYFNKLSALLIKVPFNETAFADVAILNATIHPTFGLIPNETLFSAQNVSVEGGPLEFKNLTLLPPDQYIFLDPNINQTAQNTYFVGITQNISSPPTSTLYWFYDVDSHVPNGNAGTAIFAMYHIPNDAPFFVGDRDPTDNEMFDFCLKLYLNATLPSQQYPLPTDIGLMINGTPVINMDQGMGWWYTTENLSGESLFFDVSSTWNTTVSFTATILITYQSALLSIFFTMFTFSIYYQNQARYHEYLFLLALGSVLAGGFGGYKVNRRRMIPRNALRSFEHIIVDHKGTGVLLWVFDFVSMEHDVALVSGFVSAIKSFLEEMKVGGLKRLGTEFGTFIREESELLTVTCITSDIGIDEELWIRGKLHKFLTSIEQQYHMQIENWKGEVGQFNEAFPLILGSVIDLDRVRKLQEHKVEDLRRKREKLQREVNRYGAMLEELKSKHDSGELNYDEYNKKRLKIEHKYDKVQKDYIYASLFLSKVPLETEVSPKEMEKLKEIQERFFEIKMQIQELRRKESEGTFNESDRKQKEKLQKELMKLIEKLDKYKKE